jgi:hypothetical protein
MLVSIVVNFLNLSAAYLGPTGGGGAFDCTLYNCTLTGNHGASGGGAYGGTLYNCTLTGNWAERVQFGGGGAYCATLYNCTLTGNSASWAGGGGAFDCTLYGCTLTGNSASESGGGACGGSIFNSVIYYNVGDNYAEGTTLNYCCTLPLPTNGVGNMAGPPPFMDLTAGDFRLREDSPCIDAGTNLLGFPVTRYDWSTGEDVVVAHITDPTDMLGNTRFIDGNGDGRVAWDIGAYEFNSFRPPRFAVQPQLTAEGWKLNITGAPNKWVHLERSSNLEDWEEIWSGWMGADGVTQCTDSDLGQKVMFYRVIVP